MTLAVNIDWTAWGAGARRLWTFELFRIGDQAVHVNQIAVAIIVLLVGIWLSGKVSRMAVRRLTRMPGLKRGAAPALAKVLYYAMVVVVVLVTLDMVNIPITAFAVLGGAFAIGLGFGAQTLFNNFISGLILILEQPIRAGDLIEIEGTVGRVEEVRARCTLIKRADGVDLLVPNSRLLENNVVNWTLSDDDIRTSIVVGVVYGSPTQRVKEILEETARNHPKILSNQPINVIFDDFGADALVFEVYFWTALQTVMEQRMICSDLRFEIDRRCREEKIVIAFPQRDVHLDSMRPLEVKLVNGECGPGRPPAREADQHDQT